MSLNPFGIAPEIEVSIRKHEERLKAVFSKYEAVEFNIHYRIIQAMQKHRLADMHFNWNTGYGYNDAGREVTEKIYADVFGTESALVRPLIVNGTHALTLCLTGVLRPGDELLAITGKPYDTLDHVIGIQDKYGSSMKQFGISYRQVELLESGCFDTESILNALREETRMVYIQRSGGYSWRKAIRVDDIESVIQQIRAVKPNVIVMVDNCYGEFIEEKEPTHVGADLMAGSLIKNPGGGMALSGGYIVGREDLVEQVSYRMTSPGIGGECGLMFGQTRSILQGLFIAPSVVSGALKGAILCSSVFKDLGYRVCPEPDDLRSDIIQSVELRSAEAVIAFCQGIQSAAPVDSYVKPEPWDMPGYDDPVIMAAGAFVQGSSIELSADGPIREPYIAYFQGGLTYSHARLGVMRAWQSLKDCGIL